MSTSTRPAALYAGLLVVALLLAGIVSYVASPSPDGLDAVTRTGCRSVEVGGQEQLQGSCIAQHAGDHAAASGPLAGYALGGDDTFTGVAGVIGVLVVLVVAGGAFWVLRRRARPTSRVE